PDYALLNSGTGQTVIGYLSGPTVIGAAFGPTIPLTWPLVATADLDGDGSPDYVLYNPGSGQTAIGYLTDNIVVNAALGSIVPAGCSFLVALCEESLGGDRPGDNAVPPWDRKLYLPMGNAPEFLIDERR